MPPRREYPSDAACKAMSELVALSQRRSGIALPHVFFRALPQATTTPLKTLIAGGGGVRLKLFLTAVMRATRKPYTYDIPTPASRWALALGLPDHGTLGARRVTDAFADLDRLKFLKVHRQQGVAPTYKLRDLNGAGGRYSRPRARGSYMTVPLGLWSKSWIGALNTAELSVLLVLLDARQSADDETAFTLVGETKAQYRMSDGTWTSGLRGLADFGIVQKSAGVDRGPSNWGTARHCNVYTVRAEELRDDSKWRSGRDAAG